MASPFLMGNVEHSVSYIKLPVMTSAHMALGKHWDDLPPNEKPSPDQFRLKQGLQILYQANP
eukprot:12750289-Ditylum_brightwellii.AAC.1